MRFEKSIDVNMLTGREVGFNVEDTQYNIPTITYYDKKDMMQALSYLNSIYYFPIANNRFKFKGLICNNRNHEILKVFLEKHLENRVIAINHYQKKLQVQMEMESEIYMIDVLELLGLFPNEILFFKEDSRLVFTVKLDRMEENNKMMNRCKYE